MIKEEMLARYLEPLLRGDRKACRSVIEEAMQPNDSDRPPECTSVRAGECRAKLTRC